MDTNILAILIPMILGFLGIIFSMNSMVKSAVRDSADSTNRRIDDFRKDVDKRFNAVDLKFVDLKVDMDRRFDEVKDETRDMKKDIRELRSRLDTYIDTFALRIIAPERKTGPV